MKPSAEAAAAAAAAATGGPRPALSTETPRRPFSRTNASPRDSRRRESPPLRKRPSRACARHRSARRAASRPATPQRATAASAAIGSVTETRKPVSAPFFSRDTFSAEEETETIRIRIRKHRRRDRARRRPRGGRERRDRADRRESAVSGNLDEILLRPKALRVVRRAQTPPPPNATAGLRGRRRERTAANRGAREASLLVVASALQK